MKVRVPAIESVLHASQREVYSRLARFSVLEIGRRWGKTTFGEQVLIDDILRGRLVAWFAPTYKYLAQPMRDFEKSLKPIVARVDRVERRFEFKTGAALDFWTTEDEDAGRGREYDRVIIDEAGFARNLFAIWSSAIYPTLSSRRGSAIFLGTPKGTGDFHKLYLQGEKDDSGLWRSFRLGSASNPYMDPEEIEAARRMLPPDVFAQEMEGVPAEDGGNPFGLDAIRDCIAPLSSEAPECFGVDLAKSHDWTVLVGLDREGRVCRLERWQSPWSVTRERLAKTIGNVPAQIDSTGVGDPIVEDLRKVCRKVEGFKFTAQSKQQLVEGLQLSIQTREIRFPEGFLRSELESFGFRYSGKHVSYEATVGHDDGVCALALAVLARRSRRPLLLKVL